jgi:hypothetical protein
MVKTPLANAAGFLASAPAYGAFLRALEDPRRAEEEVFHRIIGAGAHSAFGAEHGFADIQTTEEFARNVPPRDYDELIPWIDRVARGENDILTPGSVHRLVPTSGSTTARKLIPYNDALQGELNRAIAPWMFDLYLQYPRAMLGCSYWSITPSAPMGAESSPIPIGFDDDSAYLGGWRQKFIDATMAVPGAFREISSIAALRYVTLLSLLRRRDLSVISVWHPSFLRLLLEALGEHRAELVADVARGACAVAAELPPHLVPLMLGPADPRRAEEIARAQRIAEIWPLLSVVSCWGDANAAASAAELGDLLPGVALQPKGLLATEGFVSIPFAGRHPLAVRSHYFEFLDQRDRLLGLCDLRIDETYSVLLTTGGGLYRYRLNDLVRVDAMVGRTPSIRFVGKAGLVSDQMGEKLTDGFVSTVLSRLPLRASFMLLAPDAGESGCRYTLYVNSAVPAELPPVLDELLCENPHYAYCRRLEQLLPPRAMRIEGDAYNLYCQRLQSLGQRLGNIKPSSLSPLTGWGDWFGR